MKKFSTTEKLNIAKKATRVVVGYGTGIIVMGAVISNTLPPKNIVQKAAIIVAGTVIVMAAKDKMGEYTEAKFDEVVEAVKKLFEENSKDDPKTVEA